MKRIVAAMFSILAFGQLVYAQQPIRERIEWADIWVTDADKDDLAKSATHWRFDHQGIFRCK